MNETPAFILRDLLLVGIVAGVDECLVGGKKFGDDVLVPLEDPANQVVGVADQYAGVVVGELVGVLEYFGRLVVLEEFLEKAKDAGFLQLGIVKERVDHLADAGFGVQLALGSGIEETRVGSLVGQGISKGIGDFFGSEAGPAFSVGDGSQLATKHGIRQEEHSGEAVTHARDSPGFLDVFLHQGDEAFQLGFPRVAGQDVAKLHFDGLLHLFAG